MYLPKGQPIADTNDRVEQAKILRALGYKVSLTARTRSGRGKKEENVRRLWVRLNPAGKVLARVSATSVAGNAQAVRTRRGFLLPARFTVDRSGARVPMRTVYTENDEGCLLVRYGSRSDTVVNLSLSRLLTERMGYLLSIANRYPNARGFGLGMFGAFSSTYSLQAFDQYVNSQIGPMLERASRAVENGNDPDEIFQLVVSF